MICTILFIMKKFTEPSFAGKSLELRFENNEVCIYGTKDGLEKLSAICARLAANLKDNASEHIHLQDYEMLTPKSLHGVVAVFRGKDA